MADAVAEQPICQPCEIAAEPVAAKLIDLLVEEPDEQVREDWRSRYARLTEWI
ncbi:MAG TPA: hypothetical protein VES69_07875 [Pyrinomonadaceae bacterium]|nr:hypothetical protein [Pyrinomonadaceae bacterium]